MLKVFFVVVLFCWFVCVSVFIEIHIVCKSDTDLYRDIFVLFSHHLPDVNWEQTAISGLRIL